MAQSQILKAPFPWFGGKSRVAHVVWDRFGDCYNYVEPFFGSGAVLLGRPHKSRIETVNDKDCYLANFWRALHCDPECVAWWADAPVNEADLHARHLWLVNQDDFRERMRSDPDFYDAKIAGWWVWGICCWIGGEWCWIKNPTKKRPSLQQPNGRGVHSSWMNETMHPNSQPQLKGFRGLHSVELTRPNLGSSGGIYDYFDALAARLRRVRVCCGDWKRVLGPTPTELLGLTGIFLDPPYSAEANRDKVYSEDDLQVAHQVREWAIAHGNNPKLRIALCGYEDEHAPHIPAAWECVAWKASGGYSAQSKNRRKNKSSSQPETENCTKERIWFSPHCLRPQDSLFFGMGVTEAVSNHDAS